MNRTRTVSQSDRRARRGVALVLVLGVVAFAAILSWSMLSNASMRAQVELATADSIDASYLAESGVSYAMYYLMYPAKSPVAMRQGTYNSYFPGQSGLTMWSGARGTVDTSVTNTGEGQFSIASTTSVNGIRRTLIANAAYNYDSYAVTHALALNNTSLFTIPSNLTVNGPVVLRGYCLGSTSNFSNSGPMTAAGANVTPVYSELSLLDSTNNAFAGGTGGAATDRQYAYDGKVYHAELLTSPSVGAPIISTSLTTGNRTLNPMNVWYSDNDVTINGATFTGTIMLRGSKKLTATGLSAITPTSADMPAVIADTLDVKQSSSPSRLTVNGVLWLNNTLTNSGPATSTGYLKVNGALLFGGNSPSIAPTLKSPITVTYAPCVSKIPALSLVKTMSGIAIRGWQQGTN